MKYLKGMSLGLAAAGLLSGMPVAAQDASHERVRELGIMLMVTSLRCRTTADDFQQEYRDFSARHLSRLNTASRSMQRELEGRHGKRGAKRQLDRVSVQMANMYGQGHPFLNCRQLKRLAYDLAQGDNGALADASRDLLADGRGGSASYARR
jgi:hypothetical protein